MHPYPQSTNWSHTFTACGTIFYSCSLHPSMQGKVVVGTANVGGESRCHWIVRVIPSLVAATASGLLALNGVTQLSLYSHIAANTT